MSDNTPLQIKMFNDRVRAMNASNSKILTLSQQEARALHAEIYDLLATNAALNKSSNNTNDIHGGGLFSLNGGGFR